MVILLVAVLTGLTDNNGDNDVIEWAWNAGTTTSTMISGTSLIVQLIIKMKDGALGHPLHLECVNAFTNAFNGDRANKLQTGGNAVLVTVDLRFLSNYCN